MKAAAAIQRMLGANSIAVIGASNRMGYGGRVVANLRSGGYPGRIYPVNPRHSEIQGMRAYPSVIDVPDDVDLAVIVVPADVVGTVLQDCGRKGVGSVSIISAGFAEHNEEGVILQEELRGIGRRYGVRFSGPNSVGIANTTDRIFAAAPREPLWSRSEVDLPAGRISVLSQSGALAFSTILCRAYERGVGLRHIVSVGNQADLTLTDFLEYLVDLDDATQAVAVFMEGLPAGEGRRFLEIARRAARLNKPIVVLKVGRSVQSAQNARSHTAALAGDDRVYSGAFDQGAVVRVRDPDELWEIGDLLSSLTLPRSGGAGVVAGSGGMNSLVVDHLLGEGVVVPPIGNQTLHHVIGLLGERGSAGNPTDASGHLTEDSMRGILSAISSDPAIDVTVACLTQLTSGERAMKAAGQIAGAQQDTGRPFVAIWASAQQSDLHEGTSDDGPRLLREAGIPVFHEPFKASRALGIAARYAARVEVIVADDSGQEEIPADLGEVPERFTSLMRMLERAGIGIPQTAECDDVDGAVSIASAIGYPVVLKVDVPGVAHKTEVGGVHLDIKDDDALASALREMDGRTRHLGSERRFVVQEQVAPGTEYLLGGLRDPVFGPLVSLGSGGIWVELINDVEFRVAPVSPAEAESMVDGLAASRTLGGARGRPVADRAALVDAIVQFSRLFAFRADLEELEINPLIVLPAGMGVRAVDVALIES